MPDCKLWNITAVKLTDIISFSLQGDIAFITGHLTFPVSSHWEWFFKSCICVEKMFLLSLLVCLLTCRSSSLSSEGRMLGPISSFSFHSFTPSLPWEKEEALPWFFRAIHFIGGHGHYFGCFISFGPLLRSRGMVLINEVGWITQFRLTLQALLSSIQHRRK